MRRVRITTLIMMGLVLAPVVTADEPKGPLILKGHEDYVRSLTFHPKRNLLATCGNDKTVRLWNLDAEKENTVLYGHSDAVLAVAFDPNGRFLASASRDANIILWDLESRKEAAVLKGHKDAVTTLAFFPNGESLASAGLDRSVRIWDLKSREATAVLEGHESGVYAINISASGKLLATGSEDDTVCIWNLESKKPVSRLKFSMVRGVVFSPDEKWIAAAAASDVSEGRVWSVQSGVLKSTLRGHKGGVTAVGFLSQNRVFTGGKDGTVRIWSLESGNPDLVLTSGARAIATVATNRGGTKIAAAGWDGQVYVWDLIHK